MAKHCNDTSRMAGFMMQPAPASKRGGGGRPRRLRLVCTQRLREFDLAGRTLPFWRELPEL